MGRQSPFAEAQLESLRLPSTASITLEGIEVVQVIQNLRHEVPLIVGKRTIVRCYLSVDSKDASLFCRGELRVNREDYSEYAIASLGGVEVVPLQDFTLRGLREKIQLSLNFALPDEIIDRGVYTISLKSVSHDDNTIALQLIDKSGPVKVEFLATPTLRLKIFSIRHTIGNNPVKFQPSARDIQLTASWFRRVYPAAKLQFTHAVIDAPRPWPFSCEDINMQLAASRRQDIAEGMDPRTHYYGMVSDADGSSFMRGCAADIPDHAAPDTVASGPAGKSNWNWDFDGSYADWYAGHELAHTFGRYHPGFCYGNSSNDPAFPYPNGSLTDSEGDFVGLDVGDYYAGLPMAALPGTTWRDVMTYCENQWISPYTYQGIFERLRLEDRVHGNKSITSQEAPTIESVPMHTGLIHVLASLDTTHGTGRIVQVTPVKDGVPSRSYEESQAVIELVNAEGDVLNSVPIRVKESSCCEGEGHQHGMIDALFVSPNETVAVRLIYGGKVVDTFAATVFPEDPGWVAKQLEQSSPTQESLQAPGIKYTVQISTDHGATWTTLATGLSSPQFVPEAHSFAGEKSLLMRITGTNGFVMESVTKKIYASPSNQ